jgi:hypothetical protein
MNALKTLLVEGGVVVLVSTIFLHVTYAAPPPPGTKVCNSVCITRKCDDMRYPCNGKKPGDSCINCGASSSATFCAPAASGSCTSNGTSVSCGSKWDSVCEARACVGGAPAGSHCDFVGC